MEDRTRNSEIVPCPSQAYSDIRIPPETAVGESVMPLESSSSLSGHDNTVHDPLESNEPSTTPSRRRKPDPEAIHKIEKIVQQIVRSLQREDAKISITLRSPKRPGTSSLSVKSSKTKAHEYKVSFPGETPEGAWRFSTPGLVEAVCSRTASMLTCSPAVVLRILELVHEALVNDVVVSKRNIYYKDPELFKSQRVVDRYVDILSYTFDIQRAALNVTAAAKGLVAGSFTVMYHNGSTQFYNANENATLIDNVDDIRSIDILDVAWILVVEKESTFRTLDASQIHENSRAGEGIILTAKGYPDVATRVFLRLLSTSCHPLPSIYALVDFDPDGISIMSTYKHGSIRLAHENANLRCPNVRWLGVKSGDLVFPASKKEISNNDDDDDVMGLLKLSRRDRKKAVKMLGQGIFEEDGVERECRRELQVMLMLNVKVEMEILSQQDGGIETWVENRLCEEIS
ncbi:MAG: hypothetical protein Q9169_006301 [Polycauliona sp. 2 TL-2023]